MPRRPWQAIAKGHAPVTCHKRGCFSWHPAIDDCASNPQTLLAIRSRLVGLPNIDSSWYTHSCVNNPRKIIQTYAYPDSADPKLSPFRNTGTQPPSRNCPFTVAVSHETRLSFVPFLQIVSFLNGSLPRTNGEKRSNSGSRSVLQQVEECRIGQTVGGARSACDESVRHNRKEAYSKLIRYFSHVSSYPRRKGSLISLIARS